MVFAFFCFSFSLISSCCAFVRITFCILIIGFSALFFFSFDEWMCVVQFDFSVLYREVKKKENEPTIEYARNQQQQQHLAEGVI